MAHQQVLSPLFFPAKSLPLLKPCGKKKHPKTTWSSPIHSFRTAWSSLFTTEPRGSLLSPQNHVVLSLYGCPASRFKCQHPSSFAAPFPTPPTISYTCQHPLFFQLYWAAIVSLGRCGPMARSQSSPSSHAGPVTRGVASQLHLGWNWLPSLWLKAWPQRFNISMKQVQGYRYVK